MSKIELKNPYRTSLHQEGRLQAQCVIWYRNLHCSRPALFKHLWATFNEGKNINTKLSLGLMPYVSDLLYLRPETKELVGIEIKFPGCEHEVKRVIGQARWIIDVPGAGGFCDSLELFMKIIRGESEGIDPKKVISHCEKLKSSRFIWDSKLFS